MITITAMSNQGAIASFELGKDSTEFNNLVNDYINIVSCGGWMRRKNLEAFRELSTSTDKRRWVEFDMMSLSFVWQETFNE